MTDLLKDAFERANAVSPTEQDKIAKIVLAMLDGHKVRDDLLVSEVSRDWLNQQAAQVAKQLSEAEALQKLSNVLQPRIEQARNGDLSTKSFDEIRKTAHRRAGL